MSIQWSLVLFTLLTGSGGCLFAFAGANQVAPTTRRSGFVAGAVALVLVVVGGLASVTHLSHLGRMMNALSHPSSGIFVEAVLVGVFAVLAILYLVCIKRNATGAAKVLGVLGGIVGILLAFMAGYSYVMEAQPAWNTVLLPIGYLASALPVGAGLWWGFAASSDNEGNSRGALLALACSILGLLGVLAYGASCGGFEAAPGFFLAAVICGAVALVISVVGRRRVSPAFPWIFVAASTIAALLLRVSMWVIANNMYNFFG